jgi:hypothetical protein
MVLNVDDGIGGAVLMPTSVQNKTKCKKEYKNTIAVTELYLTCLAVVCSLESP